MAETYSFEAVSSQMADAICAMSGLGLARRERPQGWGRHRLRYIWGLGVSGLRNTGVRAQAASSLSARRSGYAVPQNKNAAEERRTKLFGILPASIIAQKHGGSLC